VGIEAQRYPEITARLVRAGHQVASHSLTHPYPNLTALPKQQIAQEIQSSVRVLSTLTGEPIRDFRAPGGGVNDAMIEVLKANHLRMAWWSTNIGDWNSPTPEVIATRLHRSLRPGLVVLMHQRENSVSALDCFLADGQQGGYTYTTFSSLMRQ
jgi:peptidoglycan/xylan/chitin deacetylase (PgdA/CDA1 family)